MPQKCSSSGPRVCNHVVAAGDIGASTGIVADAGARVLKESGEPIDGLYACGNDMSSVMGGCYRAPA